MRIALVSPYSWTYPGGVTRHIEALAGEFIGGGHDVRVLAPLDPPDRRSARMHRGHEPQERPAPDWLTPLGRTVGFHANGAVSNLLVSPAGVARLRHELRHGGFDVVHLHEPVAPVLGWDATASTSAPMVGTFHCYSENVISNNIANVLGARRVLNRLQVRIAVSEAAAWTGRRFYGGRYRVIPNGVELPGAPLARKTPGEKLRLLFVGQAVERKGLPVLLRAFEALREHVPAELRILGALEDEVAPLVHDGRGITVLGKVDDAAKRAELAAADLLCAPSLGGESFGMVLTEAFAAGTPVVASDIAGYRDVVEHGVTGVLFERGNATQLAERLHDLAHEPERRAEMGAAATAAAERYAWPRVAGEVLTAYGDAVDLAAAAPARSRSRRLAERVGAAPADGLPAIRARRLPTMEPALTGRRRPAVVAARRIGGLAAAGGGVLLAFLALKRIGFDSVANSLLNSSLPWVLIGLGLMCLSMAVRAVSWHAILRAALPGARVRFTDALQGTFIGVLMSATLPARLGEPSRALIVARRTGRPRDNLPVVLGTLVSQTLLNLVALLILGVVMFSSVDVFQGHHKALLLFSIAPLVLLALVLVAPTVLGRGAATRSQGVARGVARARAALHRVRRGLIVFRRPRLGAAAAGAQLTAWGVQWMSCYTLLVALGLEHRAGVGAAAAVLFAVNVTAAIPATPSNLGVFQAACVAILHGAYHVSSADALGYGIVLQAVEIATAVIMGGPALVKEGLSWKDVRLRAMHAAPVTLSPRSDRRRGRAEVEA